MVQGLQIASLDLGKDLGMLDPDVDYEDTVLRYDVKQHQTLGPAGNSVDRFGRLYVIKVNQTKKKAV